MTWLSWAAGYEGTSDRRYFELLIPRLLEDLVFSRGTMRRVDIPTRAAVLLKRGAAKEMAQQACAERQAFTLVFIHADAGGRGQSPGNAMRAAECCEAMCRLCAWPSARCIPVMPTREMEAWVIADPAAVASILGFRGELARLGLPASPADAERVADPKAALREAVRVVRGDGRRAEIGELLAGIAQRQDLGRLRQMGSFARFEGLLLAALVSLHCCR